MKKKEKKIPDNTYRVIKISKDALFEFIYESFIDNQETFFDITDGTKIVTSFDVDWDEDSFIMVAQNSNDEPPFYNKIDVKKISDAMKIQQIRCMVRVTDISNCRKSSLMQFRERNNSLILTCYEDIKIVEFW